MKKYKSKSFCNQKIILCSRQSIYNTRDDPIILIKSELNHSFCIHPIYIKQCKAFSYIYYMW